MRGVSEKWYNVRILAPNYIGTDAVGHWQIIAFVENVLKPKESNNDGNAFEANYKVDTISMNCHR